MTGRGDKTAEAALWQRWRDTARPAADVDPLLLAAYAEGRLDENQAGPVEDWLADHPEAVADLIAARGAAAAPLQAASDSALARAEALVLPGQAKILRFPASARVHRPAWRVAANWSGLAASLVATGLIGFTLGNNAYINIAGQPTAIESPIHELLDPPSNVFAEDEDPAI